MTADATLLSLRKACACPLDHPSLEWIQETSAAVTSLLIHDYETLGDRPVGQTASRAAMETLLREPPPEEGQSARAVLEEVRAKIVPYAVRPNHPRFFAFIPGAPNFVSVLGDWLCAGLNFFAGVWKEAAAATEVELVVLDWFKEFLNYPACARGILTGGGSEANLTALVVARERLLHNERAQAIVYVSEHRHWSVDRALKIMGFRPEQLRSVSSDSAQRLTPARLRQAVDHDRQMDKLPWLVVANAGATNTGTIDPLDQLADFCRAQGLWFHVDAAYGWPAILTAAGKKSLRGIERADSITLDPHKWFGQTFEAGCVLIREGQALGQTFQSRPDYMQDVAPNEDEVNFADQGIALTRRFRALKIWFSIKVLGLGWFRRLVEHCCLLAEYAQKYLESAGSFDILCPQQLSIVCFRYVPDSRKVSGEALDKLNLQITEELLKTGRVFISTTRLDDKVALRFCFVNWRTTAADVDEAIGLIKTIGGRLAR